MSRVLLFLLLALAIYLAWRFIQRKQLPRQGTQSDPLRLPMVSCATCGLHLPRDEALVQDDRYFCCEEHRRAMPPSSE